MTQDSGVNLSIYCCFFLFLFFFWRVPVFSEWMLEKQTSIDFCILSTLREHHKNHAEIVKGTVTIL